MTTVAPVAALGEDEVNTPPGRRPSRWSRLAWLLGAWPVVLAVAGTAVVGSLSIPHNDDWSYVKTAGILARTGHLDLQGWAGNSLLGQIFLTYPVLKAFGSSAVVLNTFMAFVSLAGLGAAYILFRRFGTVRSAVLGTLVTCLFPGYLLLSTSFMSDVPAFTAMTVCVAVGLRAVERRSILWFWTALAVGTAGVTIRYQAAAAPLAVLVVWALLPNDEGGVVWRLRRSALAGGAVFAAFVAGFMWWRLALPDAENSSTSAIHLAHLARSVATAFPVLGLALLPFTALNLERLLPLWRRVGAWLLVLGSAAAFAAMHHMGVDIFAGNYLDRLGPYQIAGYGSSPPLFPLGVWLALEILGWFGGTAALLLLMPSGGWVSFAGLGAALRRNRLSSAPMLLLGSFTLLYAGILVAPTLVGWAIYDRYLFPLLVPLGAGLLALAVRTSRRARSCSAASVLLLSVVALVLTTASARDDSERWQASAQLVLQGASPTDVSSGLEWQGTYAAHPARADQLPESVKAGDLAIWTRVFPGDRDCWFVTRTANPSPGLHLTQTTVYVRFPGLPRGEFYVYRTDACAPRTSVAVRPVGLSQ